MLSLPTQALRIWRRIKRDWHPMHVEGVFKLGNLREKKFCCNHHEHPHDRVYREPRLRLWVVHEYAKMRHCAIEAIATWWSGGARLILGSCTVENWGHGNPCVQRFIDFEGLPVLRLSEKLDGVNPYAHAHLL